jgi:hypothetical protein
MPARRGRLPAATRAELASLHRNTYVAGLIGIHLVGEQTALSEETSGTLRREPATGTVGIQLARRLSIDDCLIGCFVWGWLWELATPGTQPDLSDIQLQGNQIDDTDVGVGRTSGRQLRESGPGDLAGNHAGAWIVINAQISRGAVLFQRWSGGGQPVVPNRSVTDETRKSITTGLAHTAAHPHRSSPSKPGVVCTEI